MSIIVLANKRQTTILQPIRAMPPIQTIPIQMVILRMETIPTETIRTEIQTTTIPIIVPPIHKTEVIPM